MDMYAATVTHTTQIWGAYRLTCTMPLGWLIMLSSVSALGGGRASGMWWKSSITPKKMQ